VEDNLVDQMIASYILKRQGAVVNCVLTGEQALEAIGKDDYDIVLMDLHMPGMGGYDATTEIRHRLGKNIPIVALTADAFIKSEEWEKVGMNGCICKPFDTGKLGDIISYILVHSDNNLFPN
jgi:CheY-like chemotaxis protein